MRWGIPGPCSAVDVHWLMEYLESKGRDCHLNTGVVTKLVDGQFAYDWSKDGSDMLRQDAQKAAELKTKVSLHPITKRAGPCYHTGVDTIDGICYSWHKKLTEAELDRVCVDFLDKE